MGNRSTKLPNKIVSVEEVSTLSLAKQYNQLRDFIEYFIRETEKCCICGGCPKHPRMEFIARTKEEIEEAEKVCGNWKAHYYGSYYDLPYNDEPSLIHKFKAHRSKMGEGHTNRYWSGLEEIAKKHFCKNTMDEPTEGTAKSLIKTHNSFRSVVSRFIHLWTKKNRPWASLLK